MLKIVYLLVRRLLGLAVLVVGKDLAKDAELLALRHENALPRRRDLCPDARHLGVQRGDGCLHHIGPAATQG